MQQDVFVDILFIINFSMDYLCLFICSRILHRRAKRARLLLSAALGGIYSVLSLFLQLNSFLSVVVDLSVCVMICAVGFWERRSHLGSMTLTSFLFLGVSMMLGGCMTAIFNLLNRLDLPLDGVSADGLSTYLFVIVAAIAGLICLRHGQLLSRRSTVSECELTIVIGEYSFTLRALADSGNLVKDPISGKSVIIVDKSRLQEKIDLSSLEDLTKNPQAFQKFRGLRLIPINTAAGSGLLTAFMPDRADLSVTDKKGRLRKINVDSFIAPSDISASADGYEAIVPIEIIKF